MTTTIAYANGKEALEAIEKTNIGVLQHNISLVIGTHIVKSIFMGKENGPVGLFKFAVLIKPISDAAKKGNQGAIKHLNALDNKISKVRKKVRVILKELQEDVVLPKGIVVEQPNVNDAIKIRLQFNTEYAYLVAFLLAECDQLIHHLVRQMEIGLITRCELGENINKIRKETRSILSFPLKWQPN